MLITAKFDGRCVICGNQTDRGTEVEYDPATKKVRHPSCEPPVDLFEALEAERIADKLGFS